MYLSIKNALFIDDTLVNSQHPDVSSAMVRGPDPSMLISFPQLVTDSGNKQIAACILVCTCSLDTSVMYL